MSEPRMDPDVAQIFNAIAERSVEIIMGRANRTTREMAEDYLEEWRAHLDRFYDLLTEWVGTEAAPVGRWQPHADRTIDRKALHARGSPTAFLLDRGSLQNQLTAWSTSRQFDNLFSTKVGLPDTMAELRLARGGVLEQEEMRFATERKQPRWVRVKGSIGKRGNVVKGAPFAALADVITVQGRVLADIEAFLRSIREFEYAWIRRNLDLGEDPKLAVFEHGRRSGPGQQPARPFLRPLFLQHIQNFRRSMTRNGA